MRVVASLGGGRAVAWWFSILTVAPLLGSCITEPAAMTIAACDVSERSQLEDLFNQVPAEHPLGAVIHSAAVLEDGLLGSMDQGRLQRVFAPKAHAAWHLHQLSAELDLSHFVCFSSIAGLLGSPAQANYAAANAFLDALAHLLEQPVAAERLALQVEVGVLAKDALVQAAQIGRGVDAELAGQDVTRAFERGKCVRRAARAVQGEHKQLPQALPQRQFPGEGLELAHDLAVTTLGQVGRDSILERLQAQLVHASDLGGE
jgi:hypothetical protein